MNEKALAMEAVREAARLRADYGVGPTDPVCPFMLAEKLDVLAFFDGAPSLEGVYDESTSAMILGCKRPAGRRRYTCAHELGHHVFKHGVCLEELGDQDRWSPKEFVANRFAAALLMPKLGITSAFVRRGWSASSPSADQVFIVAQEFGVGYTTLIGYLEQTLKLLPETTADSLRRIDLPRIRARLSGLEPPHDVIVVDKHRGNHPIELEVGDLLVVPAEARFEGRCLVQQPDAGTNVFCAVAQGKGVLNTGVIHTPVLVSRREFTGLARHRHLEEVADEEE